VEWVGEGDWRDSGLWLRVGDDAGLYVYLKCLFNIENRVVNVCLCVV
jgi:hypothetical protein